MMGEGFQKQFKKLNLALVPVSPNLTVTITKMILQVDPDVLSLNEKYLINQKMIVVSLIASFSR